MKIKQFDAEISSGNVFADLGLPNAEALKIKADLIAKIYKKIEQLGLNQEEAAKRLGMTPTRISEMMSGKFDSFSERQLMDCLNRLG